MTTTAERAQLYRRDGFVSPIPVLTPEAASETAKLVDDLAAACGISPIRLQFPHQFFRWAYDLAMHPALLDVVEEIVGPDILVWGVLVLSKTAYSRSKVPWHQDNIYTRFLDGAPALSAWIALTPATVESGCMRVIPGSVGVPLPFSTDREPDDMPNRGVRITADFDEGRAVDLELRPGEASLHEISVIHGSNANLSALPRTGFIVRYTTPDIRQPEYPVFCARGQAGSIRCHVPPDASPEEGLEAYVEYARSEM